ncbi:MAG: thioredoxin domain-containing protein [Solirubrobacterales bacterium]
MPNRLATETSPYLLQHRDNPVDWWPWCPEAFAEARASGRPVLLSVGYSACHWCHVMERESFEDPDTGAFLNQHFVSIKVDREERPDVDALYMEAVQSMTGHGGWPMTVFLDTDGVPFYGGTYFPGQPSRGMPSFRQVLDAVLEAWTGRREEILAAAPATTKRLGSVGRLEPSSEPMTRASLDTAVQQLAAQLDPEHGGFGGAPKFPSPSALELLLADGHHDEVEQTLDAMACGGIYDQIGGGFARYSVDAAWLVPHFEKMLYDNALLARTYLHGFLATGHDRYERVCRETLDWALREMRGPEGGFYAALDADSEGEEGRFYLWTTSQLDTVLGDQAPAVADYYGVTDIGNFEGRNILHVPGGADAPRPAGLEEAREKLRADRAERVWPGLDDKRLTSWNALMISALAEAGAVLGELRYCEAAEDCAAFVLDKLVDDAGRLLRSYNDGQGRLRAYLEDHALLVEALIALYEATFEVRWYREARTIADRMVADFADPDRGGLFTTAEDAEKLIARRKDMDDHPIPSGNASAAVGLLKLALLSGTSSYAEVAEGILRLLHPHAVRHPLAFAHLLQAVDLDLGPTREVALVGGDLARLAVVARERHRPRLVLAGGPEGQVTPELLRGRTCVDGESAAYVCERFSCQAPVTDPDELRAQLDATSPL